MENLKELKDNVDVKYAYAKHSFLRSIVRNPIKNCIIQWCILTLISVFIIAGGYFEFAELGLTDFTIVSEEDTKNFLAVDASNDLLADNSPFSPALEFRAESIFGISFLFLFTADNGRLFTTETLSEMCKVEKLAIDQDLFPFYCETEENLGNETDCTKALALSIAFNIYDEEEFENCADIDDDDIATRIFKLDPEIRDFIVDDPINPSVARSLISLAGPLGKDSPPNKDFDEVFEDFDDEQVTEGYQPLVENFVDDLFDFYDVKDRPLRSGFYTDFFQLPNSELQTQTGGVFMDTLGFLQFINVDQALSGGSFAVVLVVMAIYVKTCILACLSMTAIAMSMLVGLFLFAIVLQIDYFTALNILVLFLIAGVGADNVFVLVDAWRQSKTEAKKMTRDAKENPFLLNMSEEQITRYNRLNYAYSRASLSVAHTALTTFIAFIATLSSPIAVIAGLGLFGAMVIITNFWYMFTVHPVNLMFWYSIIGYKSDIDEEEVTSVEKKKLDDTKGEGAAKEDPVVTPVDEEEKLSCLDKVFKEYTFHLTETYFPYGSLVFMSGLAIFMIYSTAQLETPASLESNFPVGHMFQDFLLDFNNLFTSGTDDSFTEVTAVFGIEDLDVGNLKKLSADEFDGQPIFDQEFEIFSETSQEFIIKVCDDLKEVPCNEKGCTQDTLVLNGTVICPIEIFAEFVESLTPFNFSFVDAEVEGAIPSEEVFLDILEQFLVLVPPPIFSLFGFFDDRVNFLMLTYRMSMIADQPLGIKGPVIEEFDAFTDLVRAEAPPGLDNFFQSSFDHVWQHTERAFVSGLFSGLAIALTASFFVLLIGTRNPRVACFAIMGVTGVVSSVLGTVRFLPNFALGTAESIAGVFVIGLAIDYIVHLGHMFMHSRHYLTGIKNPDAGSEDLAVRLCGQTGEVAFQNKDMVSFAIEKMGETVVAGAITTFSSAAFLSLCTFVFFKKMSVLLMFTILYSVSFAFFFFLPMLRVFGPGRRDSPETLAQAEKIETKD